MELQQQKLDNENKILTQAREKEKTDNDLKSDKLKKLEDYYNIKLEIVVLYIICSQFCLLFIFNIRLL
jgi:hypothetical protein